MENEQQPDQYFTRRIEFDYPELLLSSNEQLSTVEPELVINQKCTSDESGVVWDSAILTARFFEKKQKNGGLRLQEMNIVELGSGTGFLGLWLASLGANVAITDLPTHLELSRKNLEANKHNLPGIVSRVRITDFDWSDKTKFVESNFLDWKPLNDIDYFILADCLYYEEGASAILDFIDWTSSVACAQTPKKSQKFLIAYEDRDDKLLMILSFIRKIKAQSRLRLLPIASHELGEYACEDLHLLEIAYSP